MAGDALLDDALEGLALPPEEQVISSRQKNRLFSTRYSLSFLVTSERSSDFSLYKRSKQLPPAEQVIFMDTPFQFTTSFVVHVLEQPCLKQV